MESKPGNQYYSSCSYGLSALNSVNCSSALVPEICDRTEEDLKKELGVTGVKWQCL